MPFLKYWALTFFIFLNGNSYLFSQEKQEFGYLLIESEISGIEIQVDGKLAGFTQMPPLILLSKEYTITALHPNRNFWGNLDWQQKITIAPNDTIKIAPKFTYTLNIRTTPFDADVFVDDELQGKSPLTILLERGVSNNILIRKNGYETYEISSSEIKEKYLNIALLKQDTVIPEQLTSFKISNKKKRAYRKLAYGLWGASVLTGLVTVYLKNEADSRYDKYLKAGSVADMEYYFQQSKDYDTYTLVSLGVLQGCFGLSFYFLIKSL